MARLGKERVAASEATLVVFMNRHYHLPTALRTPSSSLARISPSISAKAPCKKLYCFVPGWLTVIGETQWPTRSQKNFSLGLYLAVIGCLGVPASSHVGNRAGGALVVSRTMPYILVSPSTKNFLTTSRRRVLSSLSSLASTFAPSCLVRSGMSARRFLRTCSGMPADEKRCVALLVSTVIWSIHRSLRAVASFSFCCRRAISAWISRMVSGSHRWKWPNQHISPRGPRCAQPTVDWHSGNEQPIVAAYPGIWFEQLLIGPPIVCVN